MELQELGNDVAVFMPAYRVALQSGATIEQTGIEFDVPMGSKQVHGRLLKSQLPNGDVTVYLVEQNDYFDRDDTGCDVACRQLNYE